MGRRHICPQAELEQLSGIGPFYSSLIVIRACGHADAPIFDAGVRTSIKGSGARPADERVYPVGGSNCKDIAPLKLMPNLAARSVCRVPARNSSIKLPDLISREPSSPAQPWSRRRAPRSCQGQERLRQRCTLRDTVIMPPAPARARGHLRSRPRRAKRWCRSREPDCPLHRRACRIRRRVAPKAPSERCSDQSFST